MMNIFGELLSSVECYNRFLVPLGPKLHHVVNCSYWYSQDSQKFGGLNPQTL